MAVLTEAVVGTADGETITAVVRFENPNYFIQNILFGGGGNDTLNALPATVTIPGDPTPVAVISTLNGDEGDDILNGNSGNDTLNGGAGTDTLNGGSGNDTLVGTGSDTLNGGSGDDTLVTSGGDVAIDGGDDTDTLSASGTFTHGTGDISGTTITNVERLRPVNGAEITLTAAQLNAFASVDYDATQTGVGFTLRLATAGSIGANIGGTLAYGGIIGSSGADTIDVSHSTNGHGWGLSTGSLNVGGDVDGNVLIGGTVADTLTSGEGGDTLTGNGGNDTLHGNGGADTLNGDAGDDTLNGGDGADTLNGGIGNDTLNGGNNADVLNGGDGDDTLASDGGDTSIDGGIGTDTLHASGNVSGTTITAVENLRLGNGAEIFITTAQLNAFSTVDYDGSQSGAGFTIRLTTAGSIGSNIGSTLAYGSIIGSSGADTIDVSQTTNGHGWGLSTGSLNVGGDVGGNTLIGGTVADTLTSGEGGDTLTGNGGNDTLHGNGGADILKGGAGNDTINGGAAIDTAVFSGNRAAYTINSSTPTVTVNGLDGLDTLNGVERLQFDDTIVVLTKKPVNDFNGDGRSDILFSNEGAVFGSNYEWQMNDRSISSQGAIDLYDKTFNLQVVGDYNGDGMSDLILQNPTTGGVWQWQLNGTSITSQGAVDVADPSFHLMGSADFSGDGKDDLLFRNDAGFVYMWMMNGRVNTPAPVQGLDPLWHVQGAGDFDGDGKADILLRNIGGAASENGAFFLWKMNGNTIIGQGGIERPGTDWQTLGIGDFDGDGKSDFAVRHVSNFQLGETPGAVWVYLMDGTAIKSQGAAGIADAAAFDVAGIGDYNGDGKDDIMFRNDAGFFYSWDMNGTQIASEGPVPWAHPSFQVVTQHWDLV